MRDTDFRATLCCALVSVDSGNVNTKFENGILHIKYQNKKKISSKKIEIKSELSHRK